jgi:hypothetical protein
MYLRCALHDHAQALRISCRWTDNGRPPKRIRRPAAAAMSVMICRAGITNDTAPLASDFASPAENGVAAMPAHRSSWGILLVAIFTVASMLALLVNRLNVPPLIESDYCYQLIAVERAARGLGFTSLQPVAPNQPWEWEYDFAFLTQWPVGYPAVIYLIRRLFGIPTIAACKWLSILACSVSVVGWFTWVRGSMPRGAGTFLLASLAAGTCLSVSMLLNPSTDALLLAGVPWSMLLAQRGLLRATESCATISRPTIALWIASGLLAGGLVWFRYAALFLPVGIGAYLLLLLCRRRVPFSHVSAFAVASLLPIAALLMVNRVLGPPASLNAQLNLGRSVSVSPSLDHVLTAWQRLSETLPFGRGAYAQWLGMILPPAVWIVALSVPRFRKRIPQLFSSPSTGLAVGVMLSLMLMLLSASTFFSGKYHYVGLDRYYAPIRPLFLVFALAPLLLMERPLARLPLLAALLGLCTWTANHHWLRPLARAAGETWETTAYGRRAVAFAPGAENLHRWLRAQPSDNLILFSNFHEYLTLETDLPAAPLPSTREGLNHRVAAIAAARNLTRPRVLLAIDPDNRWRSYFLPTFETVVNRLRLDENAAHTLGGARVFEWSSFERDPAVQPAWIGPSD